MLCFVQCTFNCCSWRVTPGSLLTLDFKISGAECIHWELTCTSEDMNCKGGTCAAPTTGSRWNGAVSNKTRMVHEQKSRLKFYLGWMDKRQTLGTTCVFSLWNTAANVHVTLISIVLKELSAHFPGGLQFRRSFLLNSLLAALGGNKANCTLQSYWPVYSSCYTCWWELIMHGCAFSRSIICKSVFNQFSFHCFFQIASDYQTHHRLRESQGRDMAEYLNERIQWWSIGEACLILSVGICQVVILRRFFAEKRSTI